MNKLDASTVTHEDLHDPDCSVMLTMHTKSFTNSQKDWHVFEGEFYAQIYGAVEKCGNFINTCLAPFFDSPIPKFAWGADSTVTLFRLPKVSLPDMKIAYLSAKTSRFMGWRDRAAFTKYWPQCRLHVPDAVNNLPDMAVRIADQLKRRIPHAVDFDEVASCPCSLPVALHSFAAPEHISPADMPRITGMPVSLPHNLAAYTLAFSASEWESISDAYMHDHTEYCGVRISEIYTVLHQQCQSDQANALTSNSKRIRQWHNRVIFPVIIASDDSTQYSVCPDDHRVLYTYSSASIDPTSDSSVPDLVLLVPQAARARVSRISPEEHPWTRDMPDQDWSDWYLREDLIWTAHNPYTPHSTLSATIALVKEQAWWPTLENDCRKWIDSCAFCTSKLPVCKAVNFGSSFPTRFQIMQVDDKRLSKRVSELTGYYSIQSMVEPTHPIVVFACKKSATAREFVLTVATRWIPYYGTPMVISSDLDKALIGELAQFMCSRVGIPDRMNTI